VNQLSVQPDDGTRISLAQLRGVPCDGVEYRLQIGRRARNYPQDVGRRRLLLERLFRLLEQADVFNCDHRLVGKGLEERDLLVREWTDLPASDRDHPDCDPLAEQRHCQHRAGASLQRQRGRAREVVLGRNKIVDVDGHGVDHGATARNISSNPHGIDPSRPVDGHGLQEVSLNLANGGIGRATEPRSACRDRLHHGLDVGRRARDHPQDVGRRRLLLERLSRLVEQPHVLDGDDGLGGKGLEKRDLALRERTWVGASDGHRTDGPPLLQHRHRDDTAKGYAHLRRDLVLGVVSNVRDMHDALRQDGPSGGTPVARRHWERALDGSGLLWIDVRQRGSVNEFAIERRNSAGACAAQVHRTVGDCVEHRLEIGRRARDHLQDVGRGRLLLQRLRQPLLQVANPGPFVLPRLAGDRELRFDLGLRGLRTPTHQPPLHRAMVGARLRQGVRGGKYEWLGSSLTQPKRGYWTDCQCIR
jgi:hypothetical protein